MRCVEHSVIVSVSFWSRCLWLNCFRHLNRRSLFIIQLIIVYSNNEMSALSIQIQKIWSIHLQTAQSNLNFSEHISKAVKSRKLEATTQLGGGEKLRKYFCPPVSNLRREKMTRSQSGEISGATGAAAAANYALGRPDRSCLGVLERPRNQRPAIKG
jgi:hypothetical protein